MDICIGIPEFLHQVCQGRFEEPVSPWRAGVLRVTKIILTILLFSDCCMECINPESDLIIFLTAGTLRDLIAYTRFGEDRSTGFDVARGRIFGFSIDCGRRPYSIFALSCAGGVLGVRVVRI